jgi:hypothetical protein
MGVEKKKALQQSQFDPIKFKTLHNNASLQYAPMIISVNFPVPSTSTPKLPPALAKIAHHELVLVELQGELEVECTSDSERDGRLVGRLCIDDAAVRHFSFSLPRESNRADA